MPKRKVSAHELINLPNILTYLRIATVPLVIVFLNPPVSPVDYNVAFSLCFFATLTDYFDGIVARRQNRVTSIGKLMDPLADKLLVSAVFIMLIPLKKVQAWVTFLVISREIVITGLRSLAASHGLIIQASRSGKNKMVSQSIAMLFLLLYIPKAEKTMYNIGYTFLWISIFFGYWSAIRYFVVFYREIRRAS